MSIQEHFYKETLKNCVRTCQNYTEKMKQDLCRIIDCGQTPEEICQAVLLYFATYTLQ